MLPWMVFAVLCCTSSRQATEPVMAVSRSSLASSSATASHDAGVDPRLLDAQNAFDEATKLKEAGKYTDAISKAEQALALREAALGGTHLKVAECLSLAGVIYLGQGDYP